MCPAMLAAPAVSLKLYRDDLAAKFLGHWDLSPSRLVCLSLFTNLKFPSAKHKSSISDKYEQH